MQIALAVDFAAFLPSLPDQLGLSEVVPPSWTVWRLS